MVAEKQSISILIDRLKDGDEEAVADIWRKFYQRLVELARRKLAPQARRTSDEDDAASQAFASFIRRAQAGSFPQLENRDDLWRLLAAITDRKLRLQLRHERAAKRGGGAVRGESVFHTSDGPMGSLEEQARSGEPSPELAAELSEQLQYLLGQLPNDECRAIAQLEFEGCARVEISERIGRSVPTVDRRLRLIRKIWKRELEQ